MCNFKSKYLDKDIVSISDNICLGIGRGATHGTETRT